MKQSPRPKGSPSPMRLLRSSMPLPPLQANTLTHAANVAPPPSSENIQVMIRIRKNLVEESQRSTDPILVEGNQIQIQYSNDIKSQTYSFDTVATQDHDNQHVFKSVGLPVANYCLQGFNACIFAYGQTGAGKTHTMTGTTTDAGLQPRVLEYLFEALEKRVAASELVEYRMSVSYYEIYNEQINDLITNRKDIRIRENFEGPFIENLTNLQVTTFQEAQQHFLNSNKNRSIGATLMNKQSSRSHSIFTVTITMVGANNEITSKLNFVDMAGSERQKKTQAEGQRLKEAGSINKSLFEFSKVIGDLAKQKQQIVFRNSKLTHILKDCLVGNSRTWIICAINPSAYYLDETDNTLKFASNAKFIETKPMFNCHMKVDVEEIQERLRQAESLMEAAVKEIRHKDSLLEQLQIHAETQDEQMKQMQQYYNSSIAEIEAERAQAIDRMEQEISQMSEQTLHLQQTILQMEQAHRELSQRSDQQEIQIEEHKQRINKLLEEKKNLVLENAKNMLSSKTPVASQPVAVVTHHQSRVDSTPTPAEPENDGARSADLSGDLVRLEVEVSILRNQNAYNKTIQKELETLNSTLSNRNMEMHMTSSNLLREKESLIMEMNRINQTIGQKSQMLTNEIDNYKEQLLKIAVQLEESRKTVSELESELMACQHREQDLLVRLDSLKGANNQTVEKDARIQSYLIQIHQLVSELKKREDQVKSIEDEQVQTRKRNQEIQQISLSIISEINSESSGSSIQEITKNEYQNHLKKVLLEKCEQLNYSISSSIVNVSTHQQGNKSSHPPVPPPSLCLANNGGTIPSQKEQKINEKKMKKKQQQQQQIQQHHPQQQSQKKSAQIREQLEIFFMENPDFYVNKKRLECFDRFIRFAFSTLLTNQNNTSATLARVRQFMDQCNYDMLSYSFKDLITSDRQKNLKKYETLKQLLLNLSAGSSNGSAPQPNKRFQSAEEMNKYSEYIDMYAEQNQVNQIQTLLFDEFNLLNLRKSKRSPIGKQVLSDRSANFEVNQFKVMTKNTNMMMVMDHDHTMYDHSPVARKKTKPN